MPTSNASATWDGGLKGGNGRFDGESGAIGGSYSFGTRFGGEKGSNPEELLAAAEAACYSMALAGALEANGTPSQQVRTQAACTVERSDAGFTITGIRLDTTVKGVQLDDATFQRIVQETKKTCPVSRALTGVNIEVQASME
jgi:osmotically inducible protein OsmC